MKKNLKSRLILIIAVLLIFTYGIFGIPSGFSGKDIAASLTKRIHLGLDLQGGVHLILQVQVQEAVSDETDSVVARLEQELKTAHLAYSQVYKPDPSKPQLVRIEGVATTGSGSVRSLLDDKYSTDYDVDSSNNDTVFTLTMKQPVEKALEEKTLDQAIETIEDRVNSLGVREPRVAPYSLGSNQILVELPGISDLDQVKNAIQSTARLEIHAVVGGPYQDEPAALAANSGAIPPDEMMVHGSGTMVGGSDSDSVFVVQRAPVVSGSDFRSADPGTNQNTGQRIVQFTLTDEAGNRFYDYTSQNVGKSMAVVMGGRVREVASIKEPIRDTGEIEGSFSQDEVTMLSKLLRTGALPASLTYLEDRTVGASLGADSIREGVTAAVAGVLLVWIFMLIYYRGSGVNADLALFLNLVILLGFMGFSGATLTLPGIAGVILTIGMGVDSNVLIFERIREEIRAGKSASAAVDQGFAHAWVTIVDTHVTTIVSAAILFLFGTGPVKGFAVTLTFGLAANLFTAVYVSRVIFEAHLNKLKAGEMVSI
ncbi:MAG TPA: protein translocase subunit SecD [Terracidiphilus sp.]|jgi:preprotein translocase subunit SecD|nr:protein translocase subunit SecD [Terracidiphilus sp.]